MAQAIPAAIAAIQTFASTAVGKFVVMTAVSTALNYGVNRLLARKPAGLSGTALDGGGVILAESRDILQARRIIYGRTRVGPTVRFRHRQGDYLYLILVWAGHECDAIEEVRFGDENVTAYSSRIRITHHLGAHDQTVDSNFAAELGSLWPSTSRLRGLCYSAVRVEWDHEVFPSGLLPFTAVVRGRKVWDPREGGQDPADPDTWTWKPNSALCELDYARGVPMLDGAGTLRRDLVGLGLPDARIHMDTVIASANVCDESVDLEDEEGTEPRYETHGAFDADSEHHQVFEGLENAMGGRSSIVAGKLYIRAGYWVPPVYDLTEDMLRSGTRTTRNPLSRRDLINTVTGTYISPEDDYQQIAFPMIQSAAMVAADGGELVRQMDLPLVSSQEQARRLAEQRLLRSRQGILYEAPYNLRAFPAVTGDNVRITRGRLGWENKHFEVLGSRIELASSDNGSVGIGLWITAQETHESIWDRDTDLESTLDPAPNTNLPHLRTAAPPEDLAVVSDTYQEADGTTVPRLKVSWTPAGGTFVSSGGRTEIQWKTTAGSTWQSAPGVPGNQAETFLPGLVIGTAYDVRIRHRNIAGGVSGWLTKSNTTVTGDVTAPAVPTGLTAITGTGKVVSLNWTDNAERDLAEYGVYRHTSNDPGAATKIAEVRASRFVDVNVTLGVQYWYWITAIDRSENESDKSTGVSATPGVVSGADVSTAAPSAPSAPTFASEGIYESGDGTIFAFVRVALPASLPGGAAGINILYRRNGASEWIIADQRSSGGGHARVDDLTPGVAYQFAIVAFSAFGVLSSISSTLNRTAPNKSTGPATPTGLTAELANGLPALSWAANTEKDLAGYEVWRRSEALADGFINGGFEQDFAGWWTFGSGSSDVNISASGGLGGGKAARLQVSASGSNAFLRPEALLEVGQTYRVIFWARASSGGVGLRLDAALTGTGWLGGHIAANVQLTTSYAQYSAEWTVPATYTQLQFAQGPGSDDEDIFIDNVSIVRLDDWERRATVKVTEFVGRALAPGSVAHYRIRATNNSGQHSDWSSEVILSAPAKPPAPDSGDDVTVSGVNAHWLSPGAVNVSWALPGTDISRVRVRYGVGSPTTVHYDGPPITSTTIGDLAPGEYIVEVTGFNADSSAQDSDSTTIHVT